MTFTGEAKLGEMCCAAGESNPVSPQQLELLSTLVVLVM